MNDDTWHLVKDTPKVSGFLGSSGKVNDALVVTRKMTVLLEQLLTKHPGHLRGTYLLAGAHSRLGLVLKMIDKNNESLDASRKAIEIFKRLVKEHTDVPAYAVGLGQTYINLGEVLVRHRQSSEAAEAFNGSALIGEQLARDYPDVLLFDASRAFSGLGSIAKACVEKL